MGLDVNKLNELQEDLEKRSQGSSKNWINVKKIEEPIDIRIMDPLAAMNGIYYIEVPVWWVNRQKLISPKFLGEECVLDAAVKMANTAKDAEITALLYAKENNMPKVSFSYEFWIPVLQFIWDVNKKQEIINIYDKGDNYDVNKILKFVVDDRVKIMQTGISLLKQINQLATARGGGVMTEILDGFNIQISKSGKGRDTKYAAVKTEAMPMPGIFYEDQISVIDVAKSQIFTNEYLDSVIGEYLYGEEKKEEEYAFPEIRAELEERFKEDESEEKKTPARKRPGARTAPKAEPEATEKETPVQGRGRGAAATTARGRGRNIANDMADVGDN